MFYQWEEKEASHYLRTEEVEEGEDMVNGVDDEAKDNDTEDDDGHVIPPQPEPGRRCRTQVIPPCPVEGPPFLGGPETTLLLSDYARHVANPLWVNHHNVSV